jgi:hypothetical protein
MKQFFSNPSIVGTAAGTGDIIIGATGDSTGAGLTFFTGAASGPTLTHANDIIVNSGGFRSIKCGTTNHSVRFTGSVTLNGNLNGNLNLRQLWTTASAFPASLAAAKAKRSLGAPYPSHPK